jgi:hypothetical protein
MPVHQQCSDSYSNFSGRHVAKRAAIEDETMIFCASGRRRVAGHLEIAAVIVTLHSVIRRLELLVIAVL